LQYKEWLKRGSLVVRTARQENFRLSVIEAIRYGCLPLLPNRLVYPEIIPKEFHNSVIYTNLRDLVEKLVAELRRSDQENENLRKELSSAMAHFAWQRCIDVYDKELDGLANVKSNR